MITDIHTTENVLSCYLEMTEFRYTKNVISFYILTNI